MRRCVLNKVSLSVPRHPSGLLRFKGQLLLPKTNLLQSHIHQIPWDKAGDFFYRYLVTLKMSQTALLSGLGKLKGSRNYSHAKTDVSVRVGQSALSHSADGFRLPRVTP